MKVKYEDFIILQSFQKMSASYTVSQAIPGAASPMLGDVP